MRGQKWTVLLDSSMLDPFWTRPDCTGCACSGLPGAAGAAVGEKLQQLKDLLSLASMALQSLSAQYLCLHKATAKLGFIATSIFVGLLQEGFCTHEDGKEAQDTGGGKLQEAEGTVRFSFWPSLRSLTSDSF